MAHNYVEILFLEVMLWKDSNKVDCHGFVFVDGGSAAGAKLQPHNNMENHAMKNDQRADGEVILWNMILWGDIICNCRWAWWFALRCVCVCVFEWNMLIKQNLINYLLIIMIHSLTFSFVHWGGGWQQQTTTNETQIFCLFVHFVRWGIFFVCHKLRHILLN